MWRHVCLNPFVDLPHSAVRFNLVNNAGIRKHEKADKASAARWNEILNINLMSYAPDGE
jgi:NADP-dependent 3-hydroxy acid dehydrogenase YdfG